MKFLVFESCLYHAHFVQLAELGVDSELFSLLSGLVHSNNLLHILFVFAQKAH